MTKSPCTRKCYLNKKKICSGCGRTEKQIKEWKDLTDEQKLVIIKAIKDNKNT